MDSSDISPSAAQTIDTFEDSEKKEANAKESGSVECVKVGKNGALKEMGHSILNSVNKSASQIKKPLRRKSSPLNWFPRKKTDSYLKRKIRLLQEVGGMNSSLDETLGDSNPHYSRVEREKIAAREAARKAMEARKAAMVEASWCRILRAARIPSKEAESQLVKAEKSVADAFEEAAAMGVIIMYDRPDCPRRPCEVETSSITGGGPTHTVTASFETAFEVDKEVAAAVKTAFIQLASCSNSSNKEEFRELLWKISQNPDTSETNQEFSSECESDTTSSEFESEFTSSSDIPNKEMRQRKWKNRQLATNCITKSSKLSTGLVDMMLDRLKCLQEEELASLATIVATCGLNAALLEVETSKQHESSTTNCTVGPTDTFTRNISSLGSVSMRHSNMSFMDAQMKKNQGVTELPSLDKFLVKRVSRLEREVQEAKNARKNVEESRKTTEISDEHISENVLADSIIGTSDAIPDLGHILVRHTSRLEKEIEEAKKLQRGFEDSKRFGDVQHIKLEVCHQSPKQSADIIELDEMVPSICIDGTHVDKENVNLNKPASTKITTQTGGKTTRLPPGKHMSQIERAKLEALEAFSACNAKGVNATQENNSLDKILVKSLHRLERGKMQALASGKDHAFLRYQKKRGTEVAAVESLDKVLVKHVSKLEKEKMEVHAKEDVKVRKKDQQLVNDGLSLDEILIKHQSGLEKHKRATCQQSADHVIHSETRREARERKKDNSGLSLGEILVKHQSGLEKHKQAACQQQFADHVIHSETRREARERELQEAWGGLSLGNSIRPHLSRLERDKAAWTRAEEEEQRRATEFV